MTRVILSAAKALLVKVARRSGSFAPLRTTIVLLLMGAAPHNKHFSHTRMVVDGTALVARVRLFKDDLEKTIKRPVADDAASKAAVAAYVARQFNVRVDGVALTGEVIDQGGDNDGDQPVWWVMVQWTAKGAPKRIGVRDALMFDQFDDQQNLVILSRMPGDDRRTLYFQSGDRSEQVVSY